MPLGSIAASNRLGIANCTMVNAASFGYNVLNIWYTLPMYQEHLVRSGWNNVHGPTAASADWNCASPDNESSISQTIREISVVDTQFARRNISEGWQNFFNHRITRWYQIYYLNNEPDSGHLLSSTDPGCGCWDPVERGIDSQYSGYFPNPSTQFWQPRSDNQCIRIACGQSGTGRRIQAQVLAWLFLRLKRETEGLGRGHIVLPPSSTSLDFGLKDGESSYWSTFFETVHRTGISINGVYEPPIPPANLRALHIHGYSWPGNKTPLQQVLEDASLLKNGVVWYKSLIDAWFPGQYSTLPVNVLLSEMGPLWWELQNGIPGKSHPDYQWRGIRRNFREALSWWNTWLCWLTRRAPYECNLQGWDTGLNTVYPCIHEPSLQPFVARDVATSPTRNQYYLNIDAWAVVPANNPAMVTVPNPSPNPGYQGYQESFSAFSDDYVFYQGSTFLRAPLGACYTVWSKVGPDPVTQNLDTGWASNTQAGVVGSATVSVPPGYSTIYFPVIKDSGAFGSTQFTLWWRRSGKAPLNHGYMALTDIEDSGWITYGSYAGTIFSAMVYPVVVWNSTSTYQSFAVEIHRTLSGPGAWLGRPIALKGACSWFIYQ